MRTKLKVPATANGTSCVGRTMDFPNEIPGTSGALASHYAGQSTVAPKGAAQWEKARATLR